MEEDEAKAKGDESEIPAGLSAAMFVGLIIASAALLSLLLVSIRPMHGWCMDKNSLRH